MKLHNTKEKEKVFKAAREKCQNTFKEATVRLLIDFSMPAMEARNQWNVISKLLKNPAKLEFYTLRKIFKE